MIKELYDFLSLLNKYYNNIVIIDNHILSIDRGNFIVMELSDKYKELLNEYIKETYKLLVIHDILDLKRQLKIIVDQYKEYKKKELDIDILDESFKNIFLSYTSIINGNNVTSRKAHTKLNVFYSHVNENSKWDKFTFSNDKKENDEIIESIFKDNLFYPYKPHNNHIEFIITKGLLVGVTMKTLDNLEVYNKYVKDDLYVSIFKDNSNKFNIYNLVFYLDLDF